MKLDMVEFLLHSSGVTPQEMMHLNQRMPHGQIVYGPKKLPFMDRPYMEGYKTYPELSRRGGPITYYATGTVLGLTAIALPFATATAYYPHIAGPQYQSAMSGQIGIGSSALTMRKPQSISEIFTFSYWQGY